MVSELTLIGFATIFTAGIAGWIFSSLAAGGGALLCVPILNLILPINQVAPILCTGSVIGSTHRAWLFRSNINWKILSWLLPGIISGALIGSWLFSQLSIGWLSAVIAIFLIVSGLKPYLLPHQLKIDTRLPHFLAAGFVTAILSGVIGAVGPVMNPFYLNYSIEKESILATKAVSSSLMQVAKLVGYFLFIPDTGQWFVLGIILGLGAIIGNKLGKALLARITSGGFRNIANSLLIASGILMLL